MTVDSLGPTQTQPETFQVELNLTLNLTGVASPFTMIAFTPQPGTVTTEMMTIPTGSRRLLTGFRPTCACLGRYPWTSSGPRELSRTACHLTLAGLLGLDLEQWTRTTVAGESPLGPVAQPDWAFGLVGQPRDGAGAGATVHRLQVAVGGRTLWLPVAKLASPSPFIGLTAWWVLGTYVDVLPIMC